MQDWDSLRYILAVAREGGLSGAARVLGVNHATVSRQLTRAEDAAGVKLFTRLASGLEPTEAGGVVIAHAEEVEARMVALDMALAARDENEQGEIRITVPPLMANDDFARDVKDFQDLHPGIELHILGDNRVLNLHRREADVAIRVTREPEESLWGRVMTEQRAGWFASPAFIAEHRAVIERREDGRLPFISFTKWAEPCPKALCMTHPTCRVAARTDDMVTALSLTRAGIGMARMAHFVGASDPALARVPGLDLITHNPIWVLTHPDLRHVPRVTEFMRFIAGRFRARRDVYLGTDEHTSAEPAIEFAD